MIWFEALTLGVIQGLTEFLPISSSGHLVIAPLIFGWQVQPLAFDVVLHLGTALAIIIYFFKDLLKIVRDFFADFKGFAFKFASYSRDGKILLYLLLGTLPAAILGLLFEDYVESVFRSILSVAVFLLIGTILMSVAEFFFGGGGKKVPMAASSKSVNNISAIKVLAIGVFQSLALFPGMSRSGSTIAGGMLLGLGREQAARFSFLLSLPIVLGAGFFKTTGSFDGDLLAVGMVPLLAGLVSSFVVGIMAISFLIKFLKTNTLWVFIVYRLLLVGVLLWVSLV